MARFRMLVSVAVLALLPAGFADADPVTVLPTIDHAKVQPSVAVDSAGADATDTINHAVKVNCIAGCSSSGSGAIAQGAGAVATPWYVIPTGSGGNQASVNASGQIAISGPVSQSGSWAVGLTGSLPAFASTPTMNIGTMPNVAIAGTVPVSGTFWQNTQPVSLSSLPSLASGSNTIGAISNSSFAISGTLPAFASTPTVNIGTTPTIPVSGTFWQTTQPVSLSTLPSLAAGTALVGSVTTDNVTDAVTISNSVTSASVVTSGSTQGFGGGSFQITVAGTGNTVSWEQSNDAVNWVPMYAWANGVSAPATSATTTGIYNFVAQAANVRARVSTYGSGSVTVYQTLKRSAPTQLVSVLAGAQSIGNVATVTTVSTLSAISAGANAIGDVGVQYRANATGAASSASILSPATPAGASIKASAGRIAGWTLTNSAAAVRSVKFYNATAVTMGTTAASFEVDIPAGGTVQISLPGGIGFSTGIMWSVTAGKGLTDNTGGVAANDVSGVVFFA